MLEGLDQIDWKGMGDPQIPEWLRAMAQNDRHAAGQLETRFVWLGSDTWENYGPLSELLKNDAAILIVPFFLDLLGSETFKLKECILSLLTDFAIYVELSHASTFFSHKRTREAADRILESLPYDDIYTARARKLFRLVYESREFYKTFLHGYSPAIGQCAAELLEALGELD